MDYNLLIFPDTEEPEIINIINSGEICEICIIVHTLVTKYLKNVLLQRKPREREKIIKSTDAVQYFLKTIQQYIVADATDVMREIKVRKVTAYCEESDDNFVSYKNSTFAFSADLAIAQLIFANPSTIKQLLKIVLRNCLCCLLNRPISLNTQRLVRCCKKKLKILITELQQILDNMHPTNAVYNQGHIRVKMVAIHVDAST
jgi:hypothetical protein